jgi:TPR repeat protein
MADGAVDYGDWVSTGLRTRLVELFEATEAAGESGDNAKVKRLNEEIQATVVRAMALAEQAIAAEKQGDHTQAFALYKEVADTIGESLGARACLRVGQAYLLGAGVDTDQAEARRYLEGALAGGEADALGSLGELSRPDGVATKPDRFNPGHKDKGNSFPLFSLVLMLAWVCGLAWLWPHLSAVRVFASLAVLGSLATPLLYFMVRRSGATARERIAKEFRQALINPPSSMRIGGARWVIVGGEFHRMAHDAGVRGQIYKEESSRAERHRQELGSERNRKDGIKWVPRMAILCGVALFMTPLVIPSGLVAGYFLLAGLFEVGMEFAYRHGEQWIIGAMVLDPVPRRPGHAEVESQRAHGDARLASETEAQAAASRGGAPRSPIHEQKF